MEYDFFQAIICIKNNVVTEVIKAYSCDMVKHELRVMSWIKFKSASSSPRVASLNPRVTSSNPRVTSLNPQVTSSNPRVKSSNPLVTS